MVESHLCRAFAKVELAPEKNLIECWSGQLCEAYRVTFLAQALPIEFSPSL